MAICEKCIKKSVCKLCDGTEIMGCVEFVGKGKCVRASKGQELNCSEISTDSTAKIDVPDNNVGNIDCISRKAVQTRLKEIINEMETIFANIREREVDDSVCGLCEYDCDHGLDGFANECPGFEKDDCFKLNEKYRAEWLDISNLPSVTPQESTPKNEGVSIEEINKLAHFAISATGQSDAYSLGMCNGIEYMRSALTGTKPHFFDAESEG